VLLNNGESKAAIRDFGPHLHPETGIWPRRLKRRCGDPAKTLDIWHSRTFFVN